MEKIWMDDDLRSACCRCNTSFSLFLRKHHCRVCGKIFCYYCCGIFLHLEEEEICKIPDKLVTEVDINCHEAQRCCLDCYYDLHAERHVAKQSSLIDGNCTIAVDELKEGQNAEMYRVAVPKDFQHHLSLKVDLGGNLWTLRIPSHIAPGQQVIVLAPISS